MTNVINPFIYISDQNLYPSEPAFAPRLLPCDSSLPRQARKSRPAAETATPVVFPSLAPVQAERALVTCCLLAPAPAPIRWVSLSSRPDVVQRTPQRLFWPKTSHNGEGDGVNAPPRPSIHPMKPVLHVSQQHKHYLQLWGAEQMRCHTQQPSFHRTDSAEKAPAKSP